MNKNDPQFYAGDFKAPDPRGRSLSLEDTSEFSRPTWATPQDLPVGQDIDLSRPRFNKGGLVTRTKQALGELK